MLRIPAVLAVLLTLSPVQVVNAQGGPPPALVRVDPVRLETVERQREVTGELVSLLRSSLAAEEEGPVVSLDVREGDRVTKGQLIAQLDTELAQLEVERSEAEVRSSEGLVAQREAELSQARRDEERFRELDARGSASRGELDQAETAVLRLGAQLAQAKADLAAARVRAREAQTRLNKHTIRAPFAGRIVRRDTEVGQWVQAGDAIVELVSLQQIEARLDVPESLIGQLREPGRLVTLRIAALSEPDPSDPQRLVTRSIRAPITAIIPDVDPLSRLFPIRVKLDNEQELAQPGMSVIGLIPTGSREPQLTIHKDAILRDDAGEFVFMNGGGQAIPMRIRSRFAVGDRVVIERGALQPGMELVIEGNERLFPTQPLNIMDAAPQRGAPEQGA